MKQTLTVSEGKFALLTEPTKTRQMDNNFDERLSNMMQSHQELIKRKNEKQKDWNGVFERYTHPVLTAQHTPLFWRYDLNKKTNPLLLERFGINAVFNATAIKWKNRYLMIARVESADRKSFFAIAESANGVDNFKFWDHPVSIPEDTEPDVNVYDMRIVQHEDGCLYGIFCTERRDPSADPGDQSAAVAQCGIVRTTDFETWERLPDLKTPSPQQRNVVLHPEFVNGKYAFYTRPQDGFIETGKGGGIGFGLCDNIEKAVINKELVFDYKQYHTIYEAKNGLGPSPIKTDKGWLQLAHGVRNTAAGLRYVLYVFLTDLAQPSKIIHKPAGYFLAPQGEERIGDVSNVVFSNGWIQDDDGTVLIYYASSDSRQHVAVSTTERLLDYVLNTPEDNFRSAATVDRLNGIIDANIDAPSRPQAKSFNKKIRL